MCLVQLLVRPLYFLFDGYRGHHRRSEGVGKLIGHRFTMFCRNFSFLVSVLLFRRISLVSASDAIPRSPQEDSGRDDISSLADTSGSKTNLHNFQSYEESSAITALHFASSIRNITTTNGDVLHSVPILTAQMHSILTTAKENLVNITGTLTTNFYQWNHTGWKFEVVAASNETLQYAAISAVVTRMLFLMPSAEEHNVTWTRLGKVERGDVAIADVVIIPLSPTTDSNTTVPFGVGNERIDITNATAWENALGKGEVMIHAIGVNGVTDSIRAFDPHMLDLFNATEPSQGDLANVELGKRQLSTDIERVLFREVGNTLMYATVRVWRNPNLGGPQPQFETTAFSAFMLASAVSVGLTDIALNVMRGPNEVQVVGRLVQKMQAAVTVYPLGRAAVTVAIDIYDVPNSTPGGLFNTDYIKNLMSMLAENIPQRPTSTEVPNIEGDIFVQYLDPEGTPFRKHIGKYTVTAAEIQPVIIQDELR